MKRPQLQAEERKILGKKLKQLRREGYLPGNVYGKGLESKALQVKLADFVTLYKEVGETGVIDLSFDGKTKPVLVKSLQKNFATNTLLHVDFYQVNLKQKVKATVPVLLTGEAKAVVDKVGLILQNINEVEVEALPDNLPENIEVSIEHLSEVGEQITVADMKVAEGIEVLTDPAQIIVKVAEETVAEPEPEESEEGTEGEASAEGETKEGEEASDTEKDKDSTEEKKEE